MPTTKEKLHGLVDALDAGDMETAGRVLEALTQSGRLPASLRDAPVDDEPYTDADREAVQEALEEIRRGEVVSHEEMRREFGW